MANLKMPCGICHGTVTTEQAHGMLTFPDGKVKPVHMSHHVQKEYEEQHHVPIKKGD
jgi:hypothetical protein